MASLWIRSGLGWPKRDFWVVCELCHAGAHVKALDALIFTLNFFDIPRLPSLKNVIYQVGTYITKSISIDET